VRRFVVLVTVGHFWQRRSHSQARLLHRGGVRPSAIALLRTLWSSDLSERALLAVRPR
jgi:hypothetical protein